MEKSEINKYSELITTKPKLILCSDKDFLDDLKLAVLAEKIASFKEVICEIGSGSGEHLLMLAMKNPDKLYIGLEIRYKRIYRTAEKAELYGLRNVMVARHNARLIDKLFKPASLNGIYINFPDPWFKKRRWEKHKLITPEFIVTLENLLEKGGFISYKTDHKERFLQVCDILSTNENLHIKKHSSDLVSSEFYCENIATEFERLFVTKSLPIYFVYSEKV